MDERDHAVSKVQVRDALELVRGQIRILEQDDLEHSPENGRDNKVWYEAVAGAERSLFAHTPILFVLLLFSHL